MLRTPAHRCLVSPLLQQNSRAIYTSHRPLLNRQLIQASRCRPPPRELRPSISRPFTSEQNAMGKVRNAILKARREHTILFPTLLIATAASFCFLGLLAYDEYTREEADLGNFSPAVTQYLRTAIWNTEIRPNPEIAVEAFTRALKHAETEGLDPVSPEFAGIQIRFAAALETFGRAKGAVEILDRVVDDLMQTIEDIDQGRAPKPRVESATQTTEDKEDGAPVTSVVKASPPTTETERGRLLKQVIQCKYKISELYSSDHIQDEAAAHRSIDAAMKLLVESMRDPQSLQFDNNRAGISASEAAALLSTAGSSNLSQGRYGPALEIFKLALAAVRKATKGQPSCREALTLSNMQAAVHQMLDSANPVIDGKPATESSTRQARQISGSWARQSLQCAQAVERGEQDELCAMAVLSSWSGLASSLVELGDLKAGRAMWEQVMQNSQSQEALKPLMPLAETALRDLDRREQPAAGHG